MTELGDVVILMTGDAEPDWEEDFNRWYNEEHLGERMVLDGFLGARRFENTGDFPGSKHLALYELSSDAVLRTEPYLELGRHPTPWSLRHRGHIKLSRGVYRRTFAVQGPGPLIGKALSVVWGDVEAGWEKEFDRWYNQGHLAERIEVGYLSARRFELIEGTGQKYVAVYEMPDEKIIHTPAYKHLMANPSEWTKKMQGHMTLKRIVYRQTFPPEGGIFSRATLNAWRPKEGFKVSAR